MGKKDLTNGPSGKLEVCLYTYRTCHAKRWPTPLVVKLCLQELKRGRYRYVLLKY